MKYPWFRREYLSYVTCVKCAAYINSAEPKYKNLRACPECGYKGHGPEFTAREIAGEPAFYQGSYRMKHGSEYYECMGWSRSGETIRFARLIVIKDYQVRQVNIYVNPDKIFLKEEITS